MGLEGLQVANQAVWPELFTLGRSIIDKRRMVLWGPAKRLARRSHSLGKRSTCAGSAHCQGHATSTLPPDSASKDPARADFWHQRTRHHDLIIRETNEMCATAHTSESFVANPREA